MKIKGQQFKNSETCEGTVFASEDIPHDIATIKITGRYPEAGWAMNEIVHELAIVSEGSGKLELKGSESCDLSIGDVVSVEPGQLFAWSGDMTIVMTCSPVFTAEQYKLEVEDEV